MQNQLTGQKIKDIGMKSNCNIDVKLDADKVLDVLSTGLRKCIGKIAGKDSGDSGSRGQRSRGGRDSNRSSTQRRSGRRGGR
jgi:hypothetical protein